MRWKPLGDRQIRQIHIGILRRQHCEGKGPMLPSFCPLVFIESHWLTKLTVLVPFLPIDVHPPVGERAAATISRFPVLCGPVWDPLALLVSLCYSASALFVVKILGAHWQRLTRACPTLSVLLHRICRVLCREHRLNLCQLIRVAAEQRLPSWLPVARSNRFL